jgi:hypothetical protein
MKTVVKLLIALGFGAALSGCVVAPAPSLPSLVNGLSWLTPGGAAGCSAPPGSSHR